MKKSGLNEAMHLVAHLFDADKLEQKPTRDGFGTGLVEAGKRDKNVVVLCADLTESTRCLGFKTAYPERFVQLGVSEQSMAAIAAGMSLAGKVPFISSYACFSPGRNWEQIRTTMALSDTSVKIAGAHAGVSVGPDGATHQMLEDIAIMRVLPNMRVVVPCDSNQTHKATVDEAGRSGPAYIRFAREKSHVFTTDKTPFVIGQADVYRFGDDVTIVATGPVVYEALLTANALSKKGIEARVINCHTVKPLDVKTIVQAAKETGAIVTVEEAQAAGGLGGAIAECLGSYAPVPLERIGVQDCFGQSGEPTELMDAFGLTAPSIALATVRAMKRKMGLKVADIPEYISASEKRLKTTKKK